MHQDGSNSARARAARSRAAHDYEATELESMRRRPGALARKERPRASLMARLATALAAVRPGRPAAPVIVAAEREGEFDGLNIGE